MNAVNASDDDAAIRRVVLVGMGGFFAVVLAVLIVLLKVYREPDAANAARPAGTGPVREVAVTASEFTFDPGVIDVAQGETVRFVVTNTGKVPHEFRLSTQAEIDIHLEELHSGHASTETEQEPGMIVVDPGATATLEWTFSDEANAPDRIACLIPGHYEAGMKGELRHAR